MRVAKRLFAVLAVIAVLLGVGVALADAPARERAEGEVAGQLHTAVPFSERPTVTIGGWPFVLHLATKQYPSVRVQAAGMPTRVAETDLTLSDIDVTLTDVRWQADAVTAASALGHASLSYEALGQLLGGPVTRLPDGRLEYRAGTELFGRRVDAVVSGRLELEVAKQTVRIAEPQVELVGVGLGEDASRRLVDALVQPIELPLPYGLTLLSVTPGEKAIDLGLTGKDVSFPLR